MKIIVYPTASGFSVLCWWSRPAVTSDAAWRPAGEILDAKEFADETEARSYIARNFPEIPQANFVIRDAVQDEDTERLRQGWRDSIPLWEGAASALRELGYGDNEIARPGGNSAAQYDAMAAECRKHLSENN
jgi:hypothetical protein